MKWRRGVSSSVWFARVASLALLLAFVSSSPAARAQDEAAVDDAVADASQAWMVYSVERTLDGGTGAYAGYSDGLRASGRYEIMREPSELVIGASYTWVYRGEACDEGTEDRIVRASLPDRLYQGQTDLDDYDGRTEPLATWLWVPTDLAVGDRVRILEREFAVISRSEPTASVPAELHLRAEGSGRRDDAYGHFTTTFVDEYWFDAETGYVLRSLYEERDRGQLDGESAAFRWTERMTVTGASYRPGTNDAREPIASCHSPSPMPLAGTPTQPASTRRAPSDDDGTFFLAFLGSSACSTVLVVGLAILGIWGLVRFFSRRVVRVDGLEAKVRPIAARAELTRLPTDESPHFAHFLGHFVDHALAAGEKVAVVELSDGRPVGLGIDDVEGRVASIFAKHGDACELLRRHFNQGELFTEHRHETLPSVHEQAVRVQMPTLPLAYNVVETYEILELASAGPQAYDTSVISRMTEADVPAVATLSQEVHGVRGEKWIAAALAVGDLGFVAKLDGAIVGYAFASVVGDRARLYGNTVSPAHRSKGLGRELARARVASVAALGAARVVTEVATWNVASLEVVRSLGFAKIGTMWVETASAIRVERKLVRR